MSTQKTTPRRWQHSKAKLAEHLADIERLEAEIAAVYQAPTGPGHKGYTPEHAAELERLFAEKEIAEAAYVRTYFALKRRESNRPH